MKIILKTEKDEYIENGMVWKKLENGKRELVCIIPDEIDRIE